MHNIYFTQCYNGILVTGMLNVEEALRVEYVVRTSVNEKARAQKKAS